VRIRDPIHGTLTVSAEEKTVIDSRFFQRLRNVRQLGFGELAFPGATHTRLAHSLGAMHVASRLFEAVAARSDLSAAAQARFRAALRVAALCHDLGHMPFSHASESIAPARALLKLPSWARGGPGQHQASHEDFTTKVLLDSALTAVLREAYAPHGLTPEQLAALITGRAPPDGAGFAERGVDFLLGRAQRAPHHLDDAPHLLRLRIERHRRQARVHQFAEAPSRRPSFASGLRHLDRHDGRVRLVVQVSGYLHRHAGERALGDGLGLLLLPRLIRREALRAFDVVVAQRLVCLEP
jgi:hypothetical protein